MTIQKIVIKPGVNRENTRYTSEGGWWESDKVRFRQGNPEKIGGWQAISSNTFLGVCRSLWNWSTLAGLDIFGVGTHLKFYLESGAVYNDITPLRKAQATLAANPITTNTTGGTENVISIADTTGGYKLNDFVTIGGVAGTGDPAAFNGIPITDINKEHQITSVAANGQSFTVVVATNATSAGAGGGSSVTAAYQLNTGSAIDVPTSGWGGGTWGQGDWGHKDGTVLSAISQIRLWSQSNFGEDLIFGPVGGAIYLWDASDTLTTRATLLSAETGAAGVPTIQNGIVVSDISRFCFAFGCNPYLGADQDNMLIRWSDQEDATNWAPSATNQAGSLTLSKGSKIVSAIQSRQEILVWTDSALYAFQYVGAPAVWAAQLVGENTSIASKASVAYANGVAYWMGRDKFYRYDGTTQPLRCDLRKFIFNDFNDSQYNQVTSGTNEAFHEVWWFYPSSISSTNDKYVVYNYQEDIWYYGTMGRTAWLDSGLQGHPYAATYNNTLVEHEVGNDDAETATVNPINAYITSAQFDIDDGDKFSFVSRLLPDVTFDGSTVDGAAINMSLSTLKNSGAGRKTPASTGGNSSGDVLRTVTTPVEEYTGQINMRIRGRQISLKLESTASGVAWQSGVQRMDIRPDGRR